MAIAAKAFNRARTNRIYDEISVMSISSRILKRNKLHLANTHHPKQA